MVQTYFYLRFTAQLRRTRPELINHLENTIKKAIQNAGGTLSQGRQCITAAYDEQNLGFWLDIVMLAETILNALDEEKTEHFGYALVISGDSVERPEKICRALATGPQNGGVYIDEAIRKPLEPYVIGEPFLKWPSDRRASLRENKNTEKFTRVKELKNLMPETQRRFPHRDAIITALKQGQNRNSLIIGPAFSGKREGVYGFCDELPRPKSGLNFPPLSIRFGSGGINAITDSWSGAIQELAEKSPAEIKNTLPEINDLWRFLFQQRLRDEVSPFMIQNARLFFLLLIELYRGIAKQNNVTPIIVLENIHLAEKHARQIFMETMGIAANRQEFMITGTCNREIKETELKNWEGIFQRIIRLNGENSAPPPEQMPAELWEIVYSLSLFNRCFPANLFVQLLREEGKNPDMINRALSILYARGIIDSVQYPRLCLKNSTGRAETILGERKESIKALVRRRLLYWVKQGNLNPCFDLLIILADLKTGEDPADELILESIYSDLVSGTVREIEKAIQSGLFQIITGKDRAAAVIYNYKVMHALLTGGEDEIKSVFNDTAPDISHFPVLRAQALANHSAYHLSIRDIKPALDAIKEAILLSQGKNNFCLSESYRLFSLVNLARQQVGETNEYLNFAMENAEKSGNIHELGISSYYASASQFLFGNIAQAMRLARNAREQALTAGLPEWADRARFLEGRLVFETGAYTESYEIFETLRQKPYGRSFTDKDRMLAAWAYRAKVYFQNPLTAKPEDSGLDADLFEMEAAYLAGDTKKTVDLANALSSRSIDENFIFTEQPDWRSGFAQCELLYFSQETIWKRMICAYHSLAFCRISPEAGQEALNDIQHILREEQFSEMDPWDAFYFYAWYRILDYTGAQQIDKNTAISLAFKRLQRRASRIDDIETRRQFLSRPRWNGELSNTAREFRLI